MIDVDVLKQSLRMGEDCEKCETDWKSCQYDKDYSKMDFCGWLDDAPTIHPEQRWIPCSERLPEVNGRYLVTRGLNACGAMWNRVYLINYSDLMGLKQEMIWWSGNVGKSDFERIDDVIAWMPLPEPYKEGSDEPK